VKCMRCGKDTQDRDVFCPECLEEMERYPVKPGTVIQIPVRRDPAEKPKRKKELTLEEQLAAANKKLDLLRRWLIVMTAAAALLGTLLYFSVSTSDAQQEENSRTRNYTVVESGD